MIKLETIEISGFKTGLFGMRNPWDSHENADTVFDSEYESGIIMGGNDYKLARKLSSNGPIHGKYRRNINVGVNIIAPLYWWKEFDTYKIGTNSDSSSTMHTIHKKEFTLDMFSTEHIISHSWSEADNFNGTVPMDIMQSIINMLNECRMNYLFAKENKDQMRMKMFWWQMIQLLPSSYNQFRTIQLNYEVLANIYKNRRNHRLDEWNDFIKWSLKLPYPELFTADAEKE